LKQLPRLAALVAILAALGMGLWLASRGQGHDRRNLDALVTVGGDAVRDAMHPAIDLTRLKTAEELRLGNAIDTEIRSHFQVVSDLTVSTYLEGILRPLAAGARRKDVPYRVAVVSSPEVNAFAIAGGRLYITEGMLKFVEDEAELAAVIAHEISHVDLKHCVERLQFEQAARRIDPHLASLARLGYEIALRGFSEEQELAADENGALLAGNAVYDPWRATVLFERMGLKNKGSGRQPGRNPIREAVVLLPEALGRYLATHPPADQRIEAVRRTLLARPDLWKDKPLYVGRSNLTLRQALSVHSDPSEWETHSTAPS
jgi:predicted Zn-dependent protease